MRGRYGDARRAAVLLAALVLPVIVHAQQVCTGCHGQDGNSTMAGIPSIAGQPKVFIENQLVLMREGLRPSPAMAAVVAGMKDAEITRLAVHFAKLPAKPVNATPADAALARRGRERAKALRCGVCHLADFRGQNQIPRLAAQREDYLAAAMRAYRDDKRPGGDTIMAATLYGVSDADIDAIAHYLARQR